MLHQSGGRDHGVIGVEQARSQEAGADGFTIKAHQGQDAHDQSRKCGCQFQQGMKLSAPVPVGYFQAPTLHRDDKHRGNVNDPALCSYGLD
jgi:hypothetical protein